MRKVEGERPTESRVVAYFEGNQLRKVEVEEVGEAYYVKNGALLYARRVERTKTSEAVFQSGRLVQTLVNGADAPNDPTTWEGGFADAKAVLAEEAAFAKKPLSETGAGFTDTGIADARKALDADAAAIDRAKGTEVTKALDGPYSQGARVSGLTIGGELRRIVMHCYAESGKSTETFYLRGGKPFLIVTENYDYTLTMYMLRSRIGGLDSRRYYFFHEDGGMNTSDAWSAKDLAHYVELLKQP